MELGKALLTLRKEKNMLQKELAIHLHSSVGTISNYENDVHSPDPDTLCEIADFYNVSIDYLFGRSPYRDIPSFMKEYTKENSILFRLVQIYFLLDPHNQRMLYNFAKFLKYKKSL